MHNTTQLRLIMRLAVFLSFGWFVCQYSTSGIAQYTTANQPSLGSLISPEIGSVEGIQQFGQPLRTDPDQGVGFTYRILPSVPSKPMDQESLLWAIVHVPEAFALKAEYMQWAELVQQRQLAQENRRQNKSDELLDVEIEQSQLKIQQLQFVLSVSLGDRKRNDFLSRYAPARNTTLNARLPFSSSVRTSAIQDDQTVSSLQAMGLEVSPLGFGAGQNLSSSPSVTLVETLQHQPLIQIKVRLIEATRRNSEDFRSVLDYISRSGPLTSLVDGNNVNGNRRSTRAGTRMPSGNGLLATGGTTLATIGTGSGALVNLTSRHINFVTNVLVSEFNGDVLTVPEVTTLNGQNVEFAAGATRAFPLGLSITSGNATSRQEFFYKQIGTLVSVTPRIVNWGKHLEGAGEAPIVAQEIQNWNRLTAWMTDDANLYWPNEAERASFRGYSTSELPISFDVKKEILNQLEKYPAQDLRESIRNWDKSHAPKVHHGSEATFLPILKQPTGVGCDWKPDDCTIDLEILVRESNLGSGATETANSIANIIQVKSGHGAVMGGLIAASDIESLTKVPFLGDLPIAGYFFRSKSVDRAKSELLILVEATVLPRSDQQRSKTSEDYLLGQPYLTQDLRCNPLEVAMVRAGFSEYLPPSSPAEDTYWMKHGNKMRKVVTEFDDVFK
jgi:hypothetical protein